VAQPAQSAPEQQVGNQEDTVTRIGCDSTNLNADPAAADVAFYYVNGDYAQQEADVAAKFGSHVLLGIDVNGSMPGAAVRDWEKGDKGGSLEQWVIDHNAASGVKDACIYCDRSTIPEVRQLTGSQVLEQDYWLWIATLDGTLVTPGPPHLDAPPYSYPGTVACQVATIGGYDLSVIWDDTWHPSPSPVVHLKANINEGLRALDGALQQVLANVSRLPG
jgi:hypothetical protein